MKFLKLIKDMFVETLNQTWTLLGMFIAWCVLDGSARTIVGYAIWFSLVVWLISLRIREGKEDNDGDS
mgnify:CR=1 FL=1